MYVQQTFVYQDLCLYPDEQKHAYEQSQVFQMSNTDVVLLVYLHML